MSILQQGLTKFFQQKNNQKIFELGGDNLEDFSRPFTIPPLPILGLRQNCQENPMSDGKNRFSCNKSLYIDHPDLREIGRPHSIHSFIIIFPKLCNNRGGIPHFQTPT